MGRAFAASRFETGELGCTRLKTRLRLSMGLPLKAAAAAPTKGRGSDSMPEALRQPGRRLRFVTGLQLKYMR